MWACCRTRSSPRPRRTGSSRSRGSPRAPTRSRPGTRSSECRRRPSPWVQARRRRSTSTSPRRREMGDYVSWMLPPGASTFVGEIDPLYYMILVVTGVAFVLVELVLVWFLVKYRGRPNRRALYTHGNTRAEIIWTAVTALVVVWIGL